MAGFTYIMTNQRHTVLYIGSTDATRRRVRQHRRGKVGSFTERYNINKVVFLKEFETLAQARAYEKKIKGWVRRKKIDLINRTNPEWRNLVDE